VRALLTVLAIALSAPAGASAAIRLGPDLTRPLPSGGAHVGATGCQQTPSVNPCAFLNWTSTNPDVVVASPIDGVITSWGFRAGCCVDPQTVAHHLTLGTFKVGAQNGMSGYAYGVPDLVGETFELPPGNQLPVDPATTLPARVPIAQGERIGVTADWPIAFSLDDTIPGVAYTSFAHGYTSNGESYGAQYGGAVLQIGALVEADADHDGYGDETQDCAPTDPARHDGCSAAPPAPSLPPPIVYQCPGPGTCTTPTGGGTTPPASTVKPPVLGPIPPASDPNSVYLSLTCPPNVLRHCGGYLILVPGGAKKAAAPVRTRYVIAPGKSKKIKVPLTAALRKTLRQKGRLTVTLRLQPDGGAAKTFTRVLKLKHKPAKRARR
jgi:hypothetical protein